MSSESERRTERILRISNEKKQLSKNLHMYTENKL